MKNLLSKLKKKKKKYEKLIYNAKGASENSNTSKEFKKELRQ